MSIRVATVSFALALSFASPVQSHLLESWLPLRFVSTLSPLGSDSVDRYTGGWTNASLALLTSRDSGVAILDVGDPGRPRHIATYRPEPLPVFSQVQVVGEVAYFAVDSSGAGTAERGVAFHAVDVSQPSHPRLIRRVAWSATAKRASTRLAAYDRWLFAATSGSPRVEIFDVSDPEDPVLAHSLLPEAGFSVQNVAARYDRLVVTGQVQGPDGQAGAVHLYQLGHEERGWLRFWRAGTPPLPRWLGRIATTASASSAATSHDGRFLVVSHQSVGGSVEIHDLDRGFDSNRSLVREVDAADYALNGYGPGPVTVRGQIAYVAWHQAGAQLIDLDTIDWLGREQHVGIFGTAPRLSPLAGFRGNVAIDPSGGDDRVMLIDSRWGLYFVDTRHVLPSDSNDMRDDARRK
jgi:hypothetical protein